MAGALGFGGGAAHSQCNYEIAAIISPDDAEACWPFPASNTFAQGMNSHGEVVGWYVPCAIGNERAFYWSQHTGFVTLPQAPNVTQSYAAAINDHGVIVGRHVISGVGGKGFVYDSKAQEYMYLEPLHDGLVGQTLSSANAISDNNIVVGSRVVSGPGVAPFVTTAVVWQPYRQGSPIEDLGTLGIGPNSAGLAVNNAGEICGWTGHHSSAGYGFLRTANGETFVLGPSLGLERSICQHLNSHGLIAGALEFSLAGVPLAFTWDKVSLITIDPPPGFTGTGSAGLNDLGQLLVRVAPGLVPAIVQHGRLALLSELVVPVPGIVLDQPYALSNNGEVLLRGHLGGTQVALLLAPIDRPLTDLNADCVTGIVDLLMLLDSWGPCRGDSCPADFTGSGAVGVPDLLVLLSNWG